MHDLPGVRDEEVDASRPVALFDLDGSLLNGTSLQHIARRCGVYREAKEVWEPFGTPARVDGEALAQIAALLEGVPLGLVEEAAGQMFLRPEAGEVMTALHERGFAVGVVADSFQVTAEHAAALLGLQVTAGARLEVEEGVLTGELTPAPTGACKRWLCREAVLSRFGSVYEAPVTVAMGDGVADACMLAAADLGVASDRSCPEAVEAADVQASLLRVPAVVDAFLEEEGVALDVEPMPRAGFKR